MAPDRYTPAVPTLLAVVRRYLWLVGLALLFIVLWAREVTLPADLLLFDLASSVVARAQAHVDADVVIVHTGSPFDDAGFDWEQLITALAAQRPRQVVLLALPVGFDLRSAARQLDSGRGIPLLVGRPTRIDSDGRVSQVVWPRALGGLDDLPGELAVAPMLPIEAGGGVHFRARLRAPGGQASVERLAAGVAWPASERMVPDFTRRLLFPTLDVQHIVDGGVPGNLLRGRTVIVARPNTSDTPLLKVPGRHLTPVEFRAQVIDNLMRGRQVQRLPLAVGAPLLLLWAAVLSLFFVRASARESMYAALVLSVALLTVTLAVLALARYWLPLGELMTILLGVWIATRYIEFADQQLRIGELSRRLAQTMRTRVLPDEVLSSPDYWDNIARLLYQLLDLQRSIFLERVAGDHRLREIHAINCNIDEIDERRRDYEREPYRGALALGGPVPVSDYLETRPDDVQVLAPLMFDNQVAGFWAVSLRPEVLERQADFLRIVDTFADEIAELVFRRSALQRSSQRRSLLARVLEGHAARTLRELGTAVTLAGKRIESVEQAFVGLDSAVAVYDVFGRVVLANSNVEALMTRWGLRIYDLSYVDLLASLTGRSLVEARTLMKSVVLDGETLHLRMRPPRAAAPASGDEVWLLHVHGIVDPDGDSTLHEHPFKVACIAFELVDFETIGRAQALKSELLERLQGALLSSGMALPPAARRATGLLATDIETSSTALFPVSLAMAVRELRDAAAPLLAERGVALEVHAEDDAGPVDPLVMAAPARLVETLLAVLRFLVADARAESTIDCRLSSPPAVLELRNTGIGMPQAQLERFLAEADPHVPEALDELRSAVARIDSWGGKVEITTEVGVGSACRITFDTLDL